MEEVREADGGLNVLEGVRMGVVDVRAAVDSEGVVVREEEGILNAFGRRGVDEDEGAGERARIGISADGRCGNGGGARGRTGLGEGLAAEEGGKRGGRGAGLNPFGWVSGSGSGSVSIGEGKVDGGGMIGLDSDGFLADLASIIF